MRATRLMGWLGLGAAAAWLARLLAHAKTPPPEGRWHEVREDELHR